MLLSRCWTIVGAIAAALCVLRDDCRAGFTFHGPTPYLSAADSPFPVLSNPTFHLEDFEDDDCIPGPGVFCGGEFDVLGARLVSGNVVLGSSVDADDGVIDNNGQTAFSGVAIPIIGNPDLTRVTNVFEIEFDSEVLGFLPDTAGFVWTTGAGSLSSVTVFDASGETSIFSVANLSLSPFTAEDDRFIGFTNTAGISRIMVQRTILTTSVDQIPPFVDHLQFGLLIPEPSTFSILAITICTILGRRRRCRQHIFLTSKGVTSDGKNEK